MGSFFVETLREVFFHAHLLREELEALVQRHALELRLGACGAEYGIAHVAAILADCEARLLGGHEVRKENVSVFGRIRHHGLPYDDHLAQALIAQDLMAAIDVAMLIRKAVTTMAE